jgi:hypothetical protein
MVLGLRVLVLLLHVRVRLFQALTLGDCGLELLVQDAELLLKRHLLRLQHARSSRVENSVEGSLGVRRSDGFHVHYKTKRTLKERGHNLLSVDSLVVQAQQVRVLLLARLFLRVVKEYNGDEEIHACMIVHMVGQATRGTYLAWTMTFLARSSCSPVRHATWKSEDISKTRSTGREVSHFY